MLLLAELEKKEDANAVVLDEEIDTEEIANGDGVGVDDANGGGKVPAASGTVELDPETSLGDIRMSIQKR